MGIEDQICYLKKKKKNPGENACERSTGKEQELIEKTLV